MRFTNMVVTCLVLVVLCGGCAGQWAQAGRAWLTALEPWDNVGTVLFEAADVQRARWPRPRLALLRARRHFQTALPSPRLLVQAQLAAIHDYLRSAFATITDQHHDAETTQILQEALSDTVGGYLKAYMLPITKIYYYSGLSSFNESIKIHDLYEDIKRRLATDGAGWRHPSSDMLRALAIEQALRVPREDYWHTCSDIKLPCNSFSLLENQSDGAAIPMPFINWDDKTMFLPIVNESSFSLDSPKHAHSLRNYYSNAKCCVLMMGPLADGQFSNKFQQWVSLQVLPYVADEKLHAGLGEVLRFADLAHVDDSQTSAEDQPPAEDVLLFPSRTHQKTLLTTTPHGLLVDMPYILLVLAIFLLLCILCKRVFPRALPNMSFKTFTCNIRKNMRLCCSAEIIEDKKNVQFSPAVKDTSSQGKRNSSKNECSECGVQCPSGFASRSFNTTRPFRPCECKNRKLAMVTCTSKDKLPTTSHVENVNKQRVAKRSSRVRPFTPKEFLEDCFEDDAYSWVPIGTCAIKTSTNSRGEDSIQEESRSVCTVGESTGIFSVQSQLPHGTEVLHRKNDCDLMSDIVIDPTNMTVSPRYSMGQHQSPRTSTLLVKKCVSEVIEAVAATVSKSEQTQSLYFCSDKEIQFQPISKIQKLYRPNAITPRRDTKELNPLINIKIDTSKIPRRVQQVIDNDQHKTISNIQDFDPPKTPTKSFIDSATSNLIVTELIDTSQQVDNISTFSKIQKVEDKDNTVKVQNYFQKDTGMATECSFEVCSVIPIPKEMKSSKSLTNIVDYFPQNQNKTSTIAKSCSDVYRDQFHLILPVKNTNTSSSSNNSHTRPQLSNIITEKTYAILAPTAKRVQNANTIQSNSTDYNSSIHPKVGNNLSEKTYTILSPANFSDRRANTLQSSSTNDSNLNPYLATIIAGKAHPNTSTAKRLMQNANTIQSFSTNYSNVHPRTSNMTSEKTYTILTPIANLELHSQRGNTDFSSSCPPTQRSILKRVTRIPVPREQSEKHQQRPVRSPSPPKKVRMKDETSHQQPTQIPQTHLSSGTYKTISFEREPIKTDTRAILAPKTRLPVAENVNVKQESRSDKSKEQKTSRHHRTSKKSQGPESLKDAFKDVEIGDLETYEPVAYSDKTQLIKIIKPQGEHSGMLRLPKKGKKYQ